MRLRQAVLVAVVLGALATTAPAHAAAPTHMEAYSYFEFSAMQDGYALHGSSGLGPAATLTDGSGNPVAGRTIIFTRSGQTLCSAPTKSNGYASCEADIRGGFTATFAGDDVFAPSKATGAVIRFIGPGVEAYVLSDGATADITVH